MLPGYSVKIAPRELNSEIVDHFVAYQAVEIADRRQAIPYCERFSVGPYDRAMQLTEYTGYAASAGEALHAALEACKFDWPHLEVVSELDLDRLLILGKKAAVKAKSRLKTPS